jgi:DNA-binding transcriptional LysR family regulator
MCASEYHPLREGNMDLTDLQSFLRVAAGGSIAEAARALEVPRSTVSRRITRLEKDLGVTLLNRAGRSVSLTQPGELVASRCHQALNDLEEVEQLLADRSIEPRGTLRLTASVMFGTPPAFGQLIARYRQLCPDVDVTVQLTSRSVDILEEGIDVAFRPGPPQGVGKPGLMRRNLTRQEMVLLASPTYLRDAPRIGRLEDLADHPFIAHKIVRGAAMLARHWPAWHTIAGLPTAVVADEFELVFQVLIAGAGVGFGPAERAATFEAGGLLTRVLPDVDLGASAIFMLWPESRYLSPRVRRLLDLATAIYTEP